MLALSRGNSAHAMSINIVDCKMLTRIFLLIICSSVTTSVVVADKYLVNFELVTDEEGLALFKFVDSAENAWQVIKTYYDFVE